MALIKTTNGNGNDEGSPLTSGFFGWLKRWLKSGNGENSARDVLEELIEEREVGEVPIDDEERLLQPSRQQLAAGPRARLAVLSNIHSANSSGVEHLTQNSH